MIDPIDTIKQYSCDALRFSLIDTCTAGQDNALSIDKIESIRNFVNKLWNIGKYINNQLLLMNNNEIKQININLINNKYQFIQFNSEKSTLQSEKLTFESEKSTFESEKLTFGSEKLIKLNNLSNQYIISKLHENIHKITQLIEDYSYSEASHLLYELIWNDFADWFIEISKIHIIKENNNTNNSKTDKQSDISTDNDSHNDCAMNQLELESYETKEILIYVWINILKLLHPFMVR